MKPLYTFILIVLPCGAARADIPTIHLLQDSAWATVEYTATDWQQNQTWHGSAAFNDPLNGCSTCLETSHKIGDWSPCGARVDLDPFAIEVHTWEYSGAPWTFSTRAEAQITTRFRVTGPVQMSWREQGLGVVWATLFDETAGLDVNYYMQPYPLELAPHVYTLTLCANGSDESWGRFAFDHNAAVVPAPPAALLALIGLALVRSVRRRL
ncbi:MAG: hypothetical protein GXY33_04440 [Phycisphaerae bacterium]|nr:hypothetical protein [Phycisphaerae bacterium]